MAKASASYTIMDYTDGVTLLGSIESNHPRTTLYDTTTQSHNPSWADTSLTLTPKLHKAGSTTDLIGTLKSGKWQRKLPGGAWTDVVSGSNSETVVTATKVLTVSANKMTGNIWQIEYKFVAVYTDPVLGLDLDYEMVIAFNRVANGTSFVVARAFTPSGDQFKNGNPSSLKVKAELIRGTTQDTTNLTYAWEKSTNGTTWSAVTGSTSELSVTPAMVDSFAMFRCKITDTDASSDTYQDVFTTEGVTILDVSDPYQVVIESSAGQFFKNNTGSTTLKAVVYQDGAEVDSGGTGLTYTWTMTDKDGVADATFGSKTGKTISVSHDEIEVKGTFFCSVS
ncbi:hypothetical protein [uncultured Sphaerochaeta sp.]|uniref:hypothetical protein n=1 Tax=uncultured Sphaerochaeta sp. TaxID=886478 RepID=UPI0029C9C05A|nr:hypothetical protein [uncultured Sphaerochaeta sp.]